MVTDTLTLPTVQHEGIQQTKNTEQVTADNKPAHNEMPIGRNQTISIVYAEGPQTNGKYKRGVGIWDTEDVKRGNKH